MSFMEHMGFMMRKATKTANKLAQHSEELKNDKVAGGVVNSVIVLAAARGIQNATGSGHLNELGRGWSKSFMEHMGFVMTKDSLRRRQRSCPKIQRS